MEAGGGLFWILPTLLIKALDTSRRNTTFSGTHLYDFRVDQCVEQGTTDLLSVLPILYLQRGAISLMSQKDRLDQARQRHLRLIFTGLSFWDYLVRAVAIMPCRTRSASVEILEPGSVLPLSWLQ